jgi:hypothetical protein
MIWVLNQMATIYPYTDTGAKPFSYALLLGEREEYPNLFWGFRPFYNIDVYALVGGKSAGSTYTLKGVCVP